MFAKTGEGSVGSQYPKKVFVCLRFLLTKSKVVGELEKPRNVFLFILFLKSILANYIDNIELFFWGGGLLPLKPLSAKRQFF